MCSKKDGICIGIDLGTTNTAFGYVNDAGNVEILPNMDGQLITPSIVSLAGEKPVVGMGAKNDKFFAPEVVGECFKRYMSGSQDGKQVPLITTPDGTEFTPTQLSAEQLRYCKESAEKILGKKVTKAVISVPAYFEANGRQATKDAALVAGFEEVRLTDEPTAAITDYGLGKEGNKTIAAFDFGGGTFDICIQKIHANKANEVLAIDGNPECGGANIDEFVFQEACRRIQQEGGKLDMQEDLATWLETLDACKQAKEVLARKEQTIIPLRAGNKRIAMEFSRKQLEKLCQPIIKILEECCRQVLKKSNLQPSDVDEVVLVGGSTRLPFIPKLVQKIFGQEPLTNTDPDLCVARGNAIIAAAEFADSDTPLLIEGQTYLPSVIKTRQIAARDLCVAALTKREQKDNRNYNVPIIPVGSQLPYEAIETFTPLDARASQVNVILNDGQPGELSENTTPLVEANVESQPTSEAQNTDRIEFKIRMNEEGLVDLNVRDTLLNKVLPIQLKFHVGLTDEEIQQHKSELEKRHN